MPRRQNGVYLQRNTLIRIAFGLVGVVYAALPLFHPLNAEINFGLIVFLLLFLVDLMLEMKLESSGRSLETRRKTNEYVRGRHGIFNDVLWKINRDLTDTIKFPKNGFSFHHPSIAIEAYTNFLELLADAQMARGANRPMHVEAIHSSDPTVMLGKHALSGRIYQAQERFCASGGVITRVLCYGPEKPDPDTLAMARKMAGVGVKVRYYSIGRGLVSHTFTWDFLVIDETRQAVIWDSFTRQASGGIEEAVFLEAQDYKGCTLREVWQRIFENSEEIAPEMMGLPSPPALSN